MVLERLAGKAIPRLNRVARLWQAYFLVGAGRIAEARAMFEAALAFPSPNPWHDAWALWIHAVIRAAEGRLEDVAGMLMEASELFSRLGVIDPFFVFDRVELLMRAGHAAEARRVLEELRAGLTDPLAERLRARTDELLARVATITARA